MYLKLIEDYQHVISNSECPSVILGLSETVRDLLATYKREIDEELQERRRLQQSETYIGHLRETERNLLADLEAEKDMVTVGDTTGTYEVREKLAAVRSQIDQAIWPTHTVHEEIAFLRGDLEVLASYAEKLDTRIDNQNERIEELSIRHKILEDSVNILDKKMV